MVLGFLAGTFSAMLGIGGGVVVVPGLTIFFKEDIKRSIGTSLTVVVLTALAGLAAHFVIKRGNIRLFEALFILAGSIPGARLGGLTVNLLKGVILKRLFAFFIVLVALKLLGILNFPTADAPYRAVYPFLAVTGFFAGFLSSLFGIGGGAIIVPALYLFFGFTLQEAVPTSLAVIIPTSFAGAVFHGKFGNTDLRLVKFLVPAALAGAVLGAFISDVIAAKALREIYGIFLCAASLYLFVPFKPGNPAVSGRD